MAHSHVCVCVFNLDIHTRFARVCVVRSWSKPVSFWRCKNRGGPEAGKSKLGDVSGWIQLRPQFRASRGVLFQFLVQTLVVVEVPMKTQSLGHVFGSPSLGDWKQAF